MARILIIDDDPPLRGVLAEALSRAGHEVSMAEDGRQGIEMFRAAPADVVVTDLIMPGQEGLETIMQLRSEFPAVPIIAMSGGMVNSSLYLNMARRFGALQTLSKPFTADEILGAIGEALKPKTPPPPGAT
jgi:DNA-binding NtrC family response regulator